MRKSKIEAAKVAEEDSMRAGIPRTMVDRETSTAEDQVTVGIAPHL